MNPAWEFRDEINAASAKEDNVVATEEAEKIIKEARQEKKPYQIQKFFYHFLTNSTYNCHYFFKF